MKRRSGFSAPGTLRPGYLSKTFPVGAWAHHDTQARTGGRTGTPPHPTGGSTPTNPRLAIRRLPDKNRFHGRGRRNTPRRRVAASPPAGRTPAPNWGADSPLLPWPGRGPASRNPAAHRGREGRTTARRVREDAGTAPSRGTGRHTLPQAPARRLGGMSKTSLFAAAARNISGPARQISGRCGKSHGRHGETPCRHGKSPCRRSGSVQECRAAPFFGTPPTQAPSCGRRSKQAPRRLQYPTAAIRAAEQPPQDASRFTGTAFAAARPTAPVELPGPGRWTAGA